jgi:hypothetical protein
MAEPGTPTFDQLRIFLAVVDAGSFAAGQSQAEQSCLRYQLWYRQS